MKTGCRRRLGSIAIFAAVLLSLLAAGACANTSDETVELLEDPKFGLAHLNDEFHTIKGTLADPKFGLAHLNDEFHTIKQTLAELSQQMESLQAKVQ